MEGDPQMRVLVAGAAGALGRPLVRGLVEAGHEVIGTTRSPHRRSLVERLGGQGLVLDALDCAAVVAAVAQARPDAVVHALTALPPAGPVRPSELEATNRLRLEGTANLVAAAQQARVGRLVAESFIGVYGLGTGELLTEESPLPDPGSRAATATAALRSLEQQVLGVGGIVLRYGFFYGAGVGSTEAAVQRLRRRRLPLPGGGAGVGSWIHIHDAAAATIAALERAEAGMTYNVVDDESVSFGEYFRELAGLLGAPPPRQLPVWLARLLAPYVTAIAVDARLRVANHKLRRGLGWEPAYPTYREGLKEVAEAYRR
jgi:2-alkyl-3-oxoalkanoate reductase